MTYERAIEILADRALYDYRAMKVGLDLHTEIRAAQRVAIAQFIGDLFPDHNPYDILFEAYKVVHDKEVLNDSKVY